MLKNSSRISRLKTCTDKPELKLYTEFLKISFVIYTAVSCLCLKHSIAMDSLREKERYNIKKLK